MNNNNQLLQLQNIINIHVNNGDSVGILSDGYHTFNELYEFRKMYNAALFNEWGNTKVDLYEWSDGRKEFYPLEPDKMINKEVCKHLVHKSWKHSDGELCFGGGWFIVSAMLPTGMISNHYKAEDWGLFKVPICDKALYPYDNHSPKDVIERLLKLINNE